MRRKKQSSPPKKAPTRRPRARESRRIGRPPTFDRSEWIERLLDHIAEGGSIVGFGRDPQDLGKRLDGYPSRRRLYEWMEEDEAFGAAVKRCHRIRAAVLMEEALRISDDRTNDTIVRLGRNGESTEAPNHEWIGRSKLRMDQRVRMAAQLDRDNWSPRAQIEHAGGLTLEALLTASREPDEPAK